MRSSTILSARTAQIPPTNSASGRKIDRSESMNPKMETKPVNIIISRKYRGMVYPGNSSLDLVGSDSNVKSIIRHVVVVINAIRVQSARFQTSTKYDKPSYRICAHSRNAKYATGRKSSVVMTGCPWFFRTSCET